MKIKHLVSVLIVWALLSFCYSCSKSANSPESPNENGTGGNSSAITISGMAFPTTTTVKKGTTVTWTNKDTYAHTVTSEDNTTFSSGNMATGATFSYVAKTVGSFDYYCKYHANMRGTLVVTP